MMMNEAAALGLLGLPPVTGHPPPSQEVIREAFKTRALPYQCLGEADVQRERLWELCRAYEVCTCTDRQADKEEEIKGGVEGWIEVPTTALLCLVH